MPFSKYFDEKNPYKQQQQQQKWLQSRLQIFRKNPNEFTLIKDGDLLALFISFVVLDQILTFVSLV